MDLQSKSARIRALVKTGQFSNADVAALENTSEGTVRALKSRMKSSMKTNSLRDEIEQLRVKDALQENAIRRLTKRIAALEKKLGTASEDLDPVSCKSSLGGFRPV